MGAEEQLNSHCFGQLVGGEGAGGIYVIYGQIIAVTVVTDLDDSGAVALDGLFLVGLSGKASMVFCCAGLGAGRAAAGADNRVTVGAIEVLEVSFMVYVVSVFAPQIAYRLASESFE